MSAFKVYGVSFKKIKDRLSAKENKLDNESEEDFYSRMAKVAWEEFKKPQNKVALTKALDAPQYCDDYIHMCGEDYRSLEIRVRKENGKIGKNGKPSMSWVKLDRSEIPTADQLF